MMQQVLQPLRLYEFNSGNIIDGALHPLSRDYGTIPSFSDERRQFHGECIIFDRHARHQHASRPDAPSC
jgi:hypothetical protein